MQVMFKLVQVFSILSLCGAGASLLHSLESFLHTMKSSLELQGPVCHKLNRPEIPHGDQGQNRKINFLAKLTSWRVSHVMHPLETDISRSFFPPYIPI